MLARAAVRGASLLLLDEPLTGLDPEVRPVIARAIRGIATGHTVIVVSHGPADELDPDVVVTMDRGRVASVWKAPTPAVPGRKAWVPE
jgi:ABC-type transport system involved in cytochrome bd biosynthesis fused ATPase/permease subunit